MNVCAVFDKAKQWQKMKTFPWLSVRDGSDSVCRWSRCCNINSSVSTCWNTAAAFLRATALPPINRLNVAGIYSLLLQQLTLSPCLFGNDIHIHALVCHKAVFHSDHFLLDHIYVTTLKWLAFIILLTDETYKLKSCQHTLNPRALEKLLHTNSLQEPMKVDHQLLNKPTRKCFLCETRRYCSPNKVTMSIVSSGK